VKVQCACPPIVAVGHKHDEYFFIHVYHGLDDDGAPESSLIG
jgi:hypothetical protein